MIYPLLQASGGPPVSTGPQPLKNKKRSPSHRIPLDLPPFHSMLSQGRSTANIPNNVFLSSRATDPTESFSDMTTGTERNLRFTSPVDITPGSNVSERTSHSFGTYPSASLDLKTRSVAFGERSSTPLTHAPGTDFSSPGTHPMEGQGMSTNFLLTSSSISLGAGVPGTDS